MQFEMVNITEEDCIRLSRWEGTSDSLSICSADGIRYQEKGAGSQWHSHPEVELTIVTHGKSMRYIGDHAAPCHAGEAVLVGSRIPHCWVEEGAYAGVCVQFMLELPKLLPSRSAANRISQLWNNAQQARLFDSASSTKILQQIESIEKSRDIERLSCTFELLHLLASTLSTSSTPLTDRTHGFSLGVSDETMDHFIDWLLHHYTENISVKEAAGHCAMSRATFHRRFSRYTGNTFIEFVNQLRMAQALRELGSTGRSILEIAISVGFGSLSHFNKVFRSRYAMTPSEFRKRSLLSE